MKPRKLDRMEGEDRQSWRVIQGYVSAHMHSRLAALEGAIEVEDAQLILKTARDFVSLSELARRLHEIITSSKNPDQAPNTTHTMKSMTTGLAEEFSAQIIRSRRLPKVFGDATSQLHLIVELLRQIPREERLTVRFRRRDGRLIMSLSPVDTSQAILHTLSRQSPLLYVVSHTSESAVLALVLQRELINQAVGLYITRGVLHVHFLIAAQLTLPFGAETSSG